MTYPVTFAMARTESKAGQEAESEADPAAVEQPDFTDEDIAAADRAWDRIGRTRQDEMEGSR